MSLSNNNRGHRSGKWYAPNISTEVPKYSFLNLIVGNKILRPTTKLRKQYCTVFFLPVTMCLLDTKVALHLYSSPVLVTKNIAASHGKAPAGAAFPFTTRGLGTIEMPHSCDGGDGDFETGGGVWKTLDGVFGVFDGGARLLRKGFSGTVS
jgi:hypothetical protein